MNWNSAYFMLKCMLIYCCCSYSHFYTSLFLSLLLFLYINLNQDIDNSQFLYLSSLNDKIYHKHSFFIFSILTPNMMTPQQLISAFFCIMYDRFMSLIITYHLIQDTILNYINSNGCFSVLVWRNCSANGKGALHTDISHFRNVERLMLIHCFMLAKKTANTQVNISSLLSLAYSSVNCSAFIHLNSVLILSLHVHIQHECHLNDCSQCLSWRIT